MLGLLMAGWLDAGSPRGAQAQLVMGWGWQLSHSHQTGTCQVSWAQSLGVLDHGIPHPTTSHRGTSGFPCLGGGAGKWECGARCAGSMWSVGGRSPAQSIPASSHGVVAPRAYLEVHQLELEKLSTQIRESKRNSRLVSVVWEEPYGERRRLPGLWAHLGQTVVHPCPRAEPASVGSSGASLGSGVGLHRAPVLLPCTPQPWLGAVWPH